MSQKQQSLPAGCVPVPAYGGHENNLKDLKENEKNEKDLKGNENILQNLKTGIHHQLCSSSSVLRAALAWGQKGTFKSWWRGGSSFIP